MLPHCFNCCNCDDFVTLCLFVFSDFELEKEKSILDEQGLRIAENQENSQRNRRKLAENTRGVCLVLLLLFSNYARNLVNRIIINIYSEISVQYML